MRFPYGVVELGKMGADGIRKVVDEVIQAVSDYELDWEPYSAVGKARASGKTWKEIGVAALDGMVEQISEAFEHARNGDLSKLADLSAGVGLEAALAIATAGTSEAGTAASRTAQLAKDTAKGLASASKKTLQRMRQLIKDARELAKHTKEEWARRFAKAVEETFESLAPEMEAVAVGGGRGAIPTVEKATTMLRTKQLGEEVGDAMKVLKKRGVGKRGVDLPEFGQRLEQFATKLGPDAAKAMKKVVSTLAGADKPAAYVKAIEKLLGMPKRIAADDLMALLKRSARMDDPAKFLDDVAWFADRKISGVARTTILRKAADGAAPDLAWLRQTTLTDQRLELLASNPQTNWKTFMKVSEKPSDMFPQDIARRGLDNADYKEAGSKLRGAGAEMVVGDMELPGGLKIKRSQVPVDETAARGARGSVMDYEVVDASGRPAWLEVKGWSKRQWKQQLDNLGGKGAEYIQSLFKQLDDAKATGKPMYLAVSNAIEKTPLARELTSALEKAGHKAVTIIYFDESKLTDVARALRKAMAIAAGAAIVDAAIVGEYDDPGTD